MKYFYYRKVASTQDLAKQYLRQGKRKMAVFTAEEQTAGYGKSGRYFYSPAGTGLYFSLVIPNFEFKCKDMGLLTPALALAAVRSLKLFFPEADLKIKWVNDLYYQDHKIAGILTELLKNGLVIGLGLNLSTSVFPAQIKDRVGSLNSKNISRCELLKALVAAFIQASQNYSSGEFLTEYRGLSYLTGKKISLSLGKQNFTGYVMTIDDAGRLVVNSHGIERHFNSGEVVKVLLPEPVPVIYDSKN